MPMTDEEMEARLRDPKVRRQPMTLGAWADACEMLGKRFREMGERIAKLENELTVLRERSGMSYKGVHQRSISYARGDCVTYDGSLWVSLCDDNSGAPKESNLWQLAVKRGRDGR